MQFPYVTRFLQATRRDAIILVNGDFEEAIWAYATQLRSRTHSDVQIDISEIVRYDVTFDAKFAYHFR